MNDRRTPEADVLLKASTDVPAVDDVVHLEGFPSGAFERIPPHQVVQVGCGRVVVVWCFKVVVWWWCGVVV